MRTQYAPLVLPLTNTGAGLSAVGGKGASLAAWPPGRLAGAGLPVPGGFCVDRGVPAFRSRGRGWPRTSEWPWQACGSTTDAAEAAARRIRETFAGREMPAGTTQVIAEAYARLADGDGAWARPAWCRTRVRRCWASLWTAPSSRCGTTAGMVTSCGRAETSARPSPT